ncbi:hypothetical protein [Kitasatospora sp. NPDC088779]|uniref:hypothetical protein n=1 Tax=Kitasatospora sp. NPDC088779 TaxID=3154964 RepID=UPI00343449D0
MLTLGDLPVEFEDEPARTDPCQATGRGGQHDYDVTETASVRGASLLEAARVAAEARPCSHPRDVDDLGIDDPATGSTTMVDLAAGTGRAGPRSPDVDVLLVDHHHDGTEIHVFVDGVETDPEDSTSGAAFHIVDPGCEEDTPDHEWFLAQVTHQPRTPAAVRAFPRHCGQALPPLR